MPAVLGRQGLDRPAPSRREGVSTGAVPVPAAPRRHRAQLPRDPRVPRPPGRRARRAVDRRARAGLDRRRARDRGDRAARVAQPAADHDAARRDRRAPVRCRDRRRAPRRGARAREGADLQPPRRVRPVGSQAAAARAVVALQRAGQEGRAPARVPAVELDRARRVAVHRARGHPAAVDLLRARSRGVRARRHATTRPTRS